MPKEKESPPMYLDIDQIRVDMGDHHVTFMRGDELKGVSAGTMESLVAQGQAKPKGELTPQETDVEAGEGESSDDGDWLAKPIFALELGDKINAIFAEVGLATVGDVLQYAEANNGLTHLPGIGEKTENEVKEAISLLAP